MGERVHIGARDVGREGVRLWEDGTQFWNGAGNGAAVGGRFAFWAAGEPNDQNTVEDCAETQSIQGWNDSGCNQTKPCNATCSQHVCPTGCQCFSAGGSDYALCTTGETFREAEVACARNGMALASIGEATRIRPFEVGSRLPAPARR